MDTSNGNTAGQGFPTQATLTVSDALLHGASEASLRTKTFLSAMFGFRAKLSPGQKVWQVSVTEKCLEGKQLVQS